MRTVGEILKAERERKFYTLEEIEKITRIRKEFLQALEKGEYQKLPPQTFVQGFIRTYGKFLGLSSEKLLAVFRREFSEGKNPPRVLSSLQSPVGGKKFTLTPARILAGLVAGLIIIFFTYLWLEYNFLVGSPSLQVDSPVDQLSTSSTEVVVSGKTDPEAKVSINEQQIGVDSEGRFSQTIHLSDDANKITIASIGKSGKESVVQRTVFLKR